MWEQNCNDVTASLSWQSFFSMTLLWEITTFKLIHNISLVKINKNLAYNHQSRYENNKKKFFKSENKKKIGSECYGVFFLGGGLTMIKDFFKSG